MKHILTLAAILLTASCASQETKTQNTLPMNQTTITLNNGGWKALGAALEARKASA